MRNKRLLGFWLILNASTRELNPDQLVKPNIEAVLWWKTLTSSCGQVYRIFSNFSILSITFESYHSGFERYIVRDAISKYDTWSIICHYLENGIQKRIFSKRYRSADNILRKIVKKFSSRFENFRYSYNDSIFSFSFLSFLYCKIRMKMFKEYTPIITLQIIQQYQK